MLALYKYHMSSKGLNIHLGTRNQYNIIFTDTSWVLDGAEALSRGGTILSLSADDRSTPRLREHLLWKQAGPSSEEARLAQILLAFQHPRQGGKMSS